MHLCVIVLKCVICCETCAVNVQEAALAAAQQANSSEVGSHVASAEARAAEVLTPLSPPSPFSGAYLAATVPMRCLKHPKSGYVKAL